MASKLKLRRSICSDEDIVLGNRLGPYCGEDVENGEDGELMALIDRTDCKIKGNLVPIFDDGKMYYEAYKDIPANMALIVYLEAKPAFETDYDEVILPDNESSLSAIDDTDCILSATDDIKPVLPATKDINPMLLVVDDGKSLKRSCWNEEMTKDKDDSDDDFEIDNQGLRIVSSTSLAEKCVPARPENTISKLKWVAGIFDEWKKTKIALANSKPGRLRELGASTSELPIDDRPFWLLKNWAEMSVEELSSCFCLFFAEVKKKNGSDYPSRTLYEIAVCMQIIIRDAGVNINLFTDAAFEKFRWLLDQEMKIRQQSGVNRPVRHATHFSTEELDLLWSEWVAGDHSPEALLNAVFVLLGLHYGLRGGVEHRNLRPRQLVFGRSSSTGREYLEYTEDISKTNQGGIKRRKSEPKVIKAYELPESPQRCLVTIYRCYLGHLPKHRRDDCIYFLPKTKYSNEEWYFNRPIGKNILGNMVRKMRKAAGLGDKWTNHSLRATNATVLYNNDIP